MSDVGAVGRDGVGKPALGRMEHEAPIPLDGLAIGIAHLEAIVVTALHDANLHAAWVRADADLDAVSLAAAAREAWLACERTARGAHGAGAGHVAIETLERTMQLRRIRAHVVAASFDAAMPLGLTRLMASRIAAALEPELPFEEPSSARRAADDALGETPPAPATHPSPVPIPPPTATPSVAATVPFADALAGLVPAPARTRPTLAEIDRARRLLAYVEAHAPERHIVRLRVALRAGILPAALERPEELGPDAVGLIEAAVEDILGIDRAELRSLV